MPTSLAIVPLKLLVVDDAPEFGLLLQGVLREGGYRDVTLAASADEAYRLLGVDDSAAAMAKRPAFDVILLDIEMPLVNGLAACERIRADMRYGGIPILMVTAHREDHFVEAAFAVGATDYVCKPLRKRELLARLVAAVRRRPFDAGRDSTSSQPLVIVRTLDSLTGVADRRFLMAALRAEWKRGVRDSLPMTLVLVQLAGTLDDVRVRAAASALAATMARAGDLLARLDETTFAVLLPRVDTLGADVVAARMRHSLRAIPGSFDVGAATVMPRHDLAPESLVIDAEEAMMTLRSRRKEAAGDADSAAPDHGSVTQRWSAREPSAPVVTVDSWLAQRIPDFLQHRREEVRAILAAVSEGDLASIHTLAHSLAGTGGSYGFAFVSECGRRVAAAAQAGDTNAIVSAAEELADYLARVQVDYRP